ncbi:MAG: hypothetical protein B7X40_02470 [Cellulomonas sp. 14-74-6]|jgi:hypothetical protein|nr:MAG: hypothetical protein B7X40_02470 [Cellulomonas sp. 14-74-6]
MSEADQGTGVPDAVGELVCSGRGCRRPAAWGLLWNNPRLHTPDRRKVWLACDEHRGSLSEYLQVRAFLRDVVPVGELVRSDQGGPTP